MYVADYRGWMTLPWLSLSLPRRRAWTVERAGEDVAGVGADIAVNTSCVTTFRHLVDVRVVDVAGVARIDHAAVGRGVLVTEGDVTEVQVDTALLHVVTGLGLKDVGIVVLSTSLWLSVSLLLNAWSPERRHAAVRTRCRESGPLPAAGMDRVATALDDRGGCHGGGHGVHLSGRDVLHAGVLHGLVGVVMKAWA